MSVQLPTPQDTIKAAYDCCIDHLLDLFYSGNEIEKNYHHNQALGTLLNELSCGTEGYIYHHLVDYVTKNASDGIHHSVRTRIVRDYLSRWSVQLMSALILLAGEKNEDSK